jgi:hypothetical protein
MAEDDRQNKFVLKQMILNLKTGQALTEQAQKSVQAVSGHVREILGPFAEATDFLKETAKNMGNFFKGIGQDLGLLAGGKTIEDEQLDEAERQTGILEKILSVFSDQAKEKFREALEKKDKKPLGLFGVIALALGMAIGAVVGAIVLPFRLLLKLPGLRWLGKFIKPVMNVFRLIGAWMLKFPILGPLVKGIIKGFNTLVWPLQIVLSLIDFVKGFMATEGDLLDKIKGGVMVAIMKFLELPIRAFGWLLEQIGVEDATAKIAGRVKQVIGFIFDFVASIFQGILDMVKIFPWDAVKTVIKGVADTFLSPFKGVWDYIKESKIIKWLGSKFGGLDIEEGADPFAVKQLTKEVEFKEMDLAKVAPVTEVGAASDDLFKTQSLVQKSAINRDRENTEAVKELSKDLKALRDGQEETSNVIIAQGASRPEIERKEPPSNMSEQAGMWLDAVM